MTFDITLMRPGGAYVAGLSLISAANMNYITASLANALDPVGGGTYTNTTGTKIILNGDKGLRVEYDSGPGFEIAGIVGGSVVSGSLLTIKSGGAFVGASGSTSTIASGATLAFTSGSTISGTTIVSLAMAATSHITGQVEWDATIKTGSQWAHETGTTHTYDSGAVLIIDGTASIGGGGSFILTGTATHQSGSQATYQSGSTLLAQSGATLTAQSGATVNLGATVSRTGPLTLSGASATSAERSQQITASNTAQTVTVEADTWYVQTPSFATSAVYTMKSTSPAPPANTTITVLIYGLAGGRDIDIQREGGASIIKFTAAGTGYAAATFKFIASSWRLGPYSSDTTVAIGAP